MGTKMSKCRYLTVFATVMLCISYLAPGASAVPEYVEPTATATATSTDPVDPTATVLSTDPVDPTATATATSSEPLDPTATPTSSEPLDPSDRYYYFCHDGTTLYMSRSEAAESGALVLHEDGYLVINEDDGYSWGQCKEDFVNWIDEYVTYCYDGTSYYVSRSEAVEAGAGVLNEHGYVDFNEEDGYSWGPCDGDRGTKYVTFCYQETNYHMSMSEAVETGAFVLDQNGNPVLF